MPLKALILVRKRIFRKEYKNILMLPDRCEITKTGDPENFCRVSPPLNVSDHVWEICMAVCTDGERVTCLSKRGILYVAG